MQAIKKFGNFTGVENIERWIGRFENTFDIDGLTAKEGEASKEAQILSMYLGTTRGKNV